MAAEAAWIRDNDRPNIGDLRIFNPAENVNDGNYRCISTDERTRMEIDRRVSERFNQLMAGIVSPPGSDSPKQQQQQQQQQINQRQQLKSFKHPCRSDSLTDLDSIRTEDMEKEFRKSLINMPEDDEHVTLPNKQAKKPPIRIQSSHYLHSDLDSVSTEDYERRFRALANQTLRKIVTNSKQQLRHQGSVGESDQDTVRSTDTALGSWNAAEQDGVCESDDVGNDASTEEQGEESGREFDYVADDITRDVRYQQGRHSRVGLLDALNLSLTRNRSSRPANSLMQSNNETGYENLLSDLQQMLMDVKGQEQHQNLLRKQPQHLPPRSGERDGSRSKTVERRGARNLKNSASKHLRRTAQSAENLRIRRNSWTHDDITDDDVSNVDDGLSWQQLPRSERLKREYEIEAKLKDVDSISQADRQPVINKIDLEVSRRLHLELTKLQFAVKQTLDQKMTTARELDRVSAVLLNKKRELEEAQTLLDKNKFSLEEIRQSATRLDTEVRNKTQQLATLHRDVEEKRDSVEKLELSRRKLRDLGYTSEEVSRLISEREQLRADQERWKEGEKEKEEIKQRIFSTEQRFKEEKKLSDQVRTELEERVQVISRERDKAEEKVVELESKCKSLQEDLSLALRDKNRELERQKKKHIEEVTEYKRDAAKEITQLLEGSQQLSEQLAAALADKLRKEAELVEYRGTTDRLKQELVHRDTQRDSALEEELKILKSTIREKEAVLEALKNEAAVEQRIAVEEIEVHYKQILQQRESAYSEATTLLKQQLQEKTEELRHQQTRASEQEKWMRDTVDKLQTETRDRIQSLVNEEKRRLVSKMEEEVRVKVETTQRENAKLVRQINQELKQERAKTSDVEKKTEDLYQQITEAVTKCEQLEKIKKEVESQIDTLRTNNEREIERIKESMKQEMKETVKSFQDKLTSEQKERDQLIAQCKQLEVLEQERQREAATLEQTIEQIVTEICGKINSVLRDTNSSPINNTRSSTVANKRNESNQELPVLKVMGRLESVTDDLCRMVERLRHESEDQKQYISKLEKSTRDEVESVKARLHEEKLAALEMLKERLIKKRYGVTGFADVIRQERANEYKTKQLEWEKERLAMQRDREFLKRQLQQSTANNSELRTHSTPLRALAHGEHALNNHSQGSALDQEAVEQMLLRIKRLQLENEHLTKVGKREGIGREMRGSVPDLSEIGERDVLENHYGAERHKTSSSALGDVADLRRLERQVNFAENRARQAEDRASKIDQILTQKLVELSKLQGTLAEQNKDMLELEKAYTKLRQAGRSTSTSPIRGRRTEAVPPTAPRASARVRQVSPQPKISSFSSHARVTNPSPHRVRNSAV